MEIASHILTSVCCLASVAAWVLIIRQLGRNESPVQPAPRPTSKPDWRVALLVFLIAGLLFVGGNVPKGEQAIVPSQLEMAVGVAVEMVFIGVLWTIVGLTTPTPDGWGIRSEDPKHQIAVGLVGTAAAWLPTVLVGQVTQYLGQEQDVILLLRESGDVGTWALVALSAVVAAPLLEEMMFRVVIQGTLTARYAVWPSVVWTAVFFAAVHGWPAMIGLLPFALIAGYIYQQTGSVLSTLVMHMAFNGSMLAALAFQVLSGQN